METEPNEAKLVMQRLEAYLRVIRHIHDRTGVPFYRAQRQDIAHWHGTGIDFIKGQPVFHFAYALPQK